MGGRAALVSSHFSLLVRARIAPRLKRTCAYKEFNSVAEAATTRCVAWMGQIPDSGCQENSQFQSKSVEGSD